MFGRVAATALLTIALAAPAHADAPACWQTAWRCDDINTYRAEHGLAPLDQRMTLQESAVAWAHELAASGILRHSPAAYNGAYSEIVGMAPDWLTVMAAWDLSPAHREILQDGSLEQVGIGAAKTDTGTVFYVVQFRSGR